MSKRARVQINYKSGQSVVIECDKFSCRREPASNELAELTWENATPRALFMGFNDVESVWEL